jgi:hypothetical protein
MEKLEVDIFTDQGNNAVIKLPDRLYPGVLIQGDTLLNLVKTAESVLLALNEDHNDKLLDDAEGLFLAMSEILDEFRQIVKNSNLNVPYLEIKD